MTIKLLEAEIGAHLFERLPRGVRLNEAGRVFLTHARRLRAEMQHSVEAARAAATGNSGHLRIGFIEVAGWHGLVPNGIRRYRDQFPAVRLSLSAMPTGVQLTALRQGEIDAALVYNPPQDDDLVSTELESHPVMLAVPHDSPLAAQDSVRLKDLSGQNLVGFQRRVSPTYHDDLTTAFHGAKFAPTYVAEMTNETDMLALVSAGAGVALMNSCQRWRQPPSIRFLSVDDLKVRLRLSFVHLRGGVPPQVQHFLAALRDGIPA